VKLKFTCSIIATIITFSSIVLLQKEYHNNHFVKQENIDYKKKERALKATTNLQKNLPSFGYENLVADWNFLKYVQYFGDTEARDKVGYSVVGDYFETIVAKDPKFIKANLSLSAGNSIFAGEPKKTIALLEKSAKSLTPKMKDYTFMIFSYKAVDEILFLGDLKAAIQSYSTAAEWAEQRNDKIGDHVANLYRNTIKFLATNPDSSSTQVSGWYMILQRNNDPRIQKYAIQKIEDLGGEVIMDSDGQITVKPPKKDV